MMGEFPSLTALAESLLEEAVHYTDARVTSHTDSIVHLHNTDVIDCRIGRSSGISVRSITPHFTAFACAAAPSPDCVREMFSHVERTVGTQAGDTVLPEEVLPSDVHAEFKNNYVNHTVGEAGEWLQERMPQKDAGVTTDVILRITEEKKIFLNSENCRLSLDIARVFLHIGVSCRSTGRAFYSSNDAGATGSLENLEEKDSDLTELIEATAHRASQYAEASSPPAGVREVVLDPKFSGSIAHEIGHMFEAGSHLFPPHLLKDTSIPEISIKDTGGSKDLYGWTPFDDEGVTPEETWLIKEGVTYCNLHTLQTAVQMNEPPSGSGRAEKFSTLPISRMRNTYVTAGSEGWSREALLEESGGALLVVGGEGGIRIDAGYFVFYPAAIYRIGKKGDVESLCLPATLEGDVKEILENIDAVGKDVQFFPTVCQSRNQVIPASTGGPLIRTKLRIGRY